MPRFTLDERAEIIKKYYGNSGSIVNTQREFRREFGRQHGFSVQAIRRIVKKFERDYTLVDLKPPTRKRLVRNEENIAAVAASIEQDPQMSIRQRSAELGIARESIRLILQLQNHNLEMADTEVKRKGRPKKKEAEAPVEAPPAKKAAVVSNGDDAPLPAKRGRGRPPKAGGAAARKKVPVPGRGRGRPPKNRRKKKETEAEADDNEDEDKDESGDEADSS